MPRWCVILSDTSKPSDHLLRHGLTEVAARQAVRQLNGSMQPDRWRQCLYYALAESDWTQKIAKEVKVHACGGCGATVRFRKTCADCLRQEKAVPKCRQCGRQIPGYYRRKGEQFSKRRAIRTCHRCAAKPAAVAS